MDTVTVRLGDRSYGIHVGLHSLDRSGDVARASVVDKARRAVIVSNRNVYSLYGGRVRRSFDRAGFQVRQFLIGDGERHKTLRTAQLLYSFLIETGVERSDLVVALGGGVVGDTAGFVAATYLRGIPYLQIPTTLLAQIDSSVGGKTAVNHPLGKNLIGAFHQPSLVIIDPDTLATLPQRELRAGLCEAIKYGVIRDRRLFDRIVDRMDRLKSLDASELTHLITRCCMIKASVVAEDEREGGLRRILNYGHTVGHALEAATHYRRFLHGEAVGHGMIAAAQIAERAGMLGSGDRLAITEAVKRVGRLPATKNIALGDIIAAMRRDKKAKGGRLTFVLPVKVGRVVVESDVPSKLVRSVLRDFLA